VQRHADWAVVLVVVFVRKRNARSGQEARSSGGVFLKVQVFQQPRAGCGKNSQKNDSDDALHNLTMFRPTAEVNPGPRGGHQ
jgi:hypothetical protein